MTTDIRIIWTGRTLPGFSYKIRKYMTIESQEPSFQVFLSIWRLT